MVEILYSKIHTDVYYIRYSMETNSEQDNQHLDLLLDFAKKHEKFAMVLETLPGTSVTDKEWFENTDISTSSHHKSLNRVIAFGQVGIQLNFMRKYLDLLSKQGIETELLSSKADFESKYAINVEKEFYRVFVYPEA